MEQREIRMISLLPCLYLPTYLRIIPQMILLRVSYL